MAAEDEYYVCDEDVAVEPAWFWPVELVERLLEHDELEQRTFRDMRYMRVVTVPWSLHRGEQYWP